MKNLSLLFFLSIYISTLHAQSANLFQSYDFMDPRDKNEYTVIRIGNTTWFQENLRFESQYSFCPNIRSGKKHCGDGNFYPYTELDTICPKGWRIPLASEWEAYFEFTRSRYKVPIDKIKRDTLFKPESPLETINNSIIVSDTSKSMKLFQSGNLLHLKPLGWVQGKRRRKMGTITLWARNEKEEDLRYHLHIGSDGYVRHSHKHHIDDKKRKRRKFLVRCVCETE